MTMTRFVPFRSSDVAVLQNRLNSIFHDFASAEASASETTAAGNFVPAVDVYENAQNLVLTFEVPGIKPEELDVKIDGRTLTVKGERRFSTEVKEENYRRVERRYGSFSRSFTLPVTVNTDEVQATTEHGVLTLSLAKKAEASPKQIAVKAATAVVEAPKQAEAVAA